MIGGVHTEVKNHEGVVAHPMGVGASGGQQGVEEGVAAAVADGGVHNDGVGLLGHVNVDASAFYHNIGAVDVGRGRHRAEVGHGVCRVVLAGKEASPCGLCAAFGHESRARMVGAVGLVQQGGDDDAVCAVPHEGAVQLIACAAGCGVGEGGVIHFCVPGDGNPVRCRRAFGERRDRGVPDIDGKVFRHRVATGQPFVH